MAYQGVCAEYNGENDWTKKNVDDTKTMNGIWGRYIRYGNKSAR